MYQTALELAEAELKQRGFEARKQFNFSLIIDPSYEHLTRIAIVDHDRPICYLHEWSKAWHFQFADLAELARTVVSAKVALMNKVTELTRSASSTNS